MRTIQLLVLLFVATAASAVAHAYPQFEYSRDVDCTGCHLSPAGGNLLNENGYATAENMSQFGTAPEFMYGKVPTPDWLVLGGDLRVASGYIKTPENAFGVFPMQAELAAAALFGNFSVRAQAGLRPMSESEEGALPVWSREHYVQWQQNAEDTKGVYVRLGRMLPIFGLRLAEHTTYIRRFGGTPLFSETYGVSVSHLTEQYEAHVSGFIEDPLIEPVEHSNGAAAMFEWRLGEHAAIGAEAMVEVRDVSTRTRGGVLGKLYLAEQDILLQGELQYVVSSIDPVGAPNAVVGYLMATKMLTDAVMLDVGIGHYDPNLRIGRLDRDAVDLNLHWFTTSHLEMVINARYELIGWGQGADPGAYAILQAHYRL